MSIKTYDELILIPTFLERYRYLRLGGRVGEQTFGGHRWVNQRFYQKDPYWLASRDEVIDRDFGCDLGIPGREINSGLVIVHHMNPITMDDIKRRTKFLLDPKYLITTIDNTHKAIHYGNEDLLILDPIERTKNDTCPWRR